MSKTLTLADRHDAYNFAVGMPIALSMNAQGRLVPSTRRQRLAAWFGRARRRLTWWRQTRIVVVAIDHAQGSITTGTARWSWLRWSWVLPPRMEHS